MVLAGAICLARLLKAKLADANQKSKIKKSTELVGVWLPAGAGSAMLNIALALLGKTAVNLNYTASAGSVQWAVKQCGLRHVITAERQPISPARNAATTGSAMTSIST